MLPLVTLGCQESHLWGLCKRNHSEHELASWLQCDLWCGIWKTLVIARENPFSVLFEGTEEEHCGLLWQLLRNPALRQG